MKKANIIGWVLFWLGLLTDIGAIAALEYLGYGKPVVWVCEFDLLGAAVVIGLAMMAASIGIDLAAYVKERGNSNRKK